jgi:hypothetical protein
MIWFLTYPSGSIFRGQITADEEQALQKSGVSSNEPVPTSMRIRGAPDHVIDISQP